MTGIRDLLRCNVVRFCAFKHFIGFAILTSSATLKAISDLLKYSGRCTHIPRLITGPRRVL